MKELLFSGISIFIWYIMAGFVPVLTIADCRDSYYIFHYIALKRLKRYLLKKYFFESAKKTFKIYDHFF